MHMGGLREFVSLLTEFVRGEMVCLAVGGSGGGVSVGCQVVEFRGSIVRALGHGVLLLLFDAGHPCQVFADARG